jgi:hypothetical protein
VEREEFELACIREFSHSGHHLGLGVSRGERRERIREAILREHKSDLRWHDSRCTYAGAFAQAYQQPLDTSDMHGKRSPRHWSLGDNSAPEDDLAEDGEDSRGGS